MLDLDTFVEWWRLFDKRFPGERARGLDTAYYRYLKDRISTATFEMGAERIFGRYEFFPKPQDLIDEGERVERAAAENRRWERIRAEVGRHALIEKTTLEDEGRSIGAVPPIRLLRSGDG